MGNYINKFAKETTALEASKKQPEEFMYARDTKKVFIGGQAIGGSSGNAMDSSEVIKNDGSDLGLYTNDGTKITDIVGTGSPDASHAWSTGGNAVIPTVGIINEHLSKLQDKTTISVASDTAISAQADVYYRFDSTVDTLTVTLPNIDNTVTCLVSIMFSFTTGTNPNITFTTTNNKTIDYFDDYSIDANTSYELNVIWNGLKWIVAYGIIS